MAEIVLDQQGVPNIPSAGQVAIFSNFNSMMLETRDEANFAHSLDRISNASITSQTLPTAVSTYIVGSQLKPMNRLYNKKFTTFNWRLSVTKTAAGVATSTYSVRTGLGGDLTDSVVGTFTTTAGTAAVDEGWMDISLNVLSSGSVRLICKMTHNLNATGHATVPFVVQFVNLGTPTFNPIFRDRGQSPIVGLSAITGASDVITIQMVQSFVTNL